MKRRTFLAAAGVGLTAGCLSFQEGGGTPGETPTGTSESPPGTEAGPTGPETVGDAAITWRAETMAAVEGAPAVGAETVYVHSTDRRLYAIDRESGERQWRTDVGDPPSGGAVTPQPARGEGVVVAVTGSGIVALDRESGERAWSVPSNGGHLAASPVTDGSVVCHRLSRQRIGLVDLEGGDPVGELNADGAVRAATWNEAASRLVVLTGQRGSSEAALVTVSLPGGDQQSTASLALANELGPPNYLAAADGVVVTDADSGAVSAFDLATGDALWRREHGNGVTPPATVTGDGVYLKGFPEQEVGEMAVDLQSGAARWQLNLDGTGSCCNAAPAVAPDRVYVANTGSAGLVGVDSEGTVRWRYEGTAMPAARPAVTDERLFVPAADGTLYALSR